MILRFSLFWDKRLPFQRTPLGGGKGARPAVTRLPWRPRDAEGRAVLRHVTGHVRTKMAAPSWPFSSGAPSLLLAFLAAFLAGASPGALGSGGPERERASAWLCEGECCAGPARKGSAVAAFCSGRGPGAALRGRCCLEGQAAMIVGLDLGNCSLQRLCSSFQEASTAIVIDLSDNPLEPLPTEAFRGFSHLETLVLPLNVDCPGGSEGWNSTSVRGNSRVCQGQRNPCDGSAGLGWLCPEGSLCAPDGPGLPQCLCVSPFHGYKCLRQGTFPYLPFFGTLGAVTATLSVLLWTTQRRKAKAS